LADLARDFRFLVAAIRRAVDQLRATADAAGTRSGKAKHLRAHLDEALKAVSARVERSEGRFSTAATDIERVSLIDSLRLLNRYVSSMQEASPWLQSAAAPQLHIGLLYFLDEAAAAMLGASSEIVTTSDAKYQYATVSWPFRPILTRYGGGPPAGTRPIVIFYPPQDSASLLLHALFAHELAHPAIEEHQLLDTVLGSHLADTQFQQDFEDAAQDFTSSTKIPIAASRIELRKSVNAWTTELLCDALATEYLGPSFLLAFGAVVLTTSWNEPQKKHPPTTLRVEQMLVQLGQRGWDGRLGSELPDTYAWFQDVASSGLGATPLYEQFLIDTARRVVDDVRATATTRLGGNSYTPGAFDAIADELMAFLRQRILPAQKGDGSAVDRRAIILAGWLYVFESIKDDPTSIPKGLENDELQEFLATALEMSSVLETWRGL
jgi:hypothetical protein